MVILDFKCPHCGHVSEELVKSSDVQPVCTQCNTFMERQASAPGMVKSNNVDKVGFRTRK